MVIDFFSMEANVVWKLYKTLIRLYREYCTQAWAPVLKHRNQSVILRLESMQRRVKKITKSERLQL